MDSSIPLNFPFNSLKLLFKPKIIKRTVVIKIYAIDFEYDGIRLGNLGYLICRFDGGGLETVSNGSQITFNKISMQRGDRWELASIEYSECLQATFQICKNPCMVDDMYMSLQEVSKLTSWLNRKDFHKLKFFTDEYYDLYFEASFNVSCIALNNIPVGLELTMETKSPYALHDSETINIESDTTDWSKTIVSKSNDDGYIYPHMSIEVKSNGDLTIYNDLDDKTMQIKNCTSGEIITIDYPIITSSISEHKIQNDFNWKYFRIVNTFKTGRNNLSISIPCKIEMTYSPIVKLGV